LGGKLLGWRTRCAVEISPYARHILLSRQKDGILEPFPIWDDIKTFDGIPWKGSIDIVTGGFPCQDISAAGKGKGIEEERSGLWVEMARVIREVQPRYAFVENSPSLAFRGLGRVLGDLAELGFDARWGMLGADHVGAPHKRKRIWIVASNPNSKSKRFEQQREARRRDNIQNSGETISQHDGLKERLAYPKGNGLEGLRKAFQAHGKANKRTGRKSNPLGSDARESNPLGSDAREPSGWWSVEPNVGRVAHGVPSRMDRLKTLGNGQVPAVVKLAWSLLNGKTNAR